MNTNKTVSASAGNNDCPADALMMNFRKHISKSNGVYAKTIEISDSSIKFWKEHADSISDNGDSIIFQWDEILEEKLPPLKIKIVKKGEKWYLSYLKEYGEEITLIQGKKRKGKNKGGFIYLDKEEQPKRRNY